MVLVHLYTCVTRILVGIGIWRYGKSFVVVGIAAIGVQWMDKEEVACSVFGDGRRHAFVSLRRDAVPAAF